MSLLMGSSYLSYSAVSNHHVLYFPVPSSSSQYYSSVSALLFSCHKNSVKKGKGRRIMACVNRENSDDILFCKRKVILLTGISVLPFLNLRARALVEDSEAKTKEQKQEEKTHQGDSSPSPLISLLNGLGIFGSSVLGALYALVRKEKAASEAVIESMKTKLREKEADIVSIEKNFQSELLNGKEERSRLLEKAKEERQSLMSQLKSANSTITNLGQELQKEKKLVVEIKGQIDNLQNDLSKAEKNKEDLEEKLKEKLDSIQVLQERINFLGLEVVNKEENICDLNSRLAGNEMEFEKLNSAYKHDQDQMTGLRSEINKLKSELSKNKKEIEVRKATVDDLNSQVSSLLVERHDLKTKVEAIQKEYSEFKSSLESKVALDAKLLEEREKKFHQLGEQLELALDEVTRSKLHVADLTQERDDLKRMLDVEIQNVKNKEQELHFMHETLEKSIYDASNLEKQLKESKNICSQLEVDLSRAKAGFVEARKTLQRSIDDAEQRVELLSGELTSTKQLLEKTKKELQKVTNELGAVEESRDKLQKELADVYKKAQSTADDLNEEEKIVTSLNRELEALETQVLKDKEARKSLKKDLEETTKSLDEMNRKALTLSNHLDIANSTISSLRNEKEVLYGSLAEQKQFSQDAHDLAMSLGKARESMGKRSKQLEEELASAKGEILRLRSQMNSSRTAVNEQDQQKGGEVGGNATVSVKKRGRRKRNYDQQDGL